MTIIIANYLDIYSLEVVEEALKQKLVTFTGSYEQYIEQRNNKIDVSKEAVKEQIFVLENRLSEIVGKLSIPSRRDDPKELDREYYQVLKRLQEIKKEYMKL